MTIKAESQLPESRTAKLDEQPNQSHDTDQCLFADAYDWITSTEGLVSTGAAVAGIAGIIATRGLMLKFEKSVAALEADVLKSTFFRSGKTHIDFDEFIAGAATKPAELLQKNPLRFSSLTDDAQRALETVK